MRSQGGTINNIQRPDPIVTHVAPDFCGFFPRSRASSWVATRTAWATPEWFTNSSTFSQFFLLLNGYCGLVSSNIHVNIHKSLPWLCHALHCFHVLADLGTTWLLVDSNWGLGDQQPATCSCSCAAQGPPSAALQPGLVTLVDWLAQLGPDRSTNWCPSDVHQEVNATSFCMSCLCGITSQQRQLDGIPVVVTTGIETCYLRVQISWHHDWRMAAQDWQRDLLGDVHFTVLGIDLLWRNEHCRRKISWWIL